MDWLWLLARDFNSIIDSSERVGGASTARVDCCWFQDFLFSNGLRDLEACAAKFTWCHGVCFKD